MLYSFAFEIVIPTTREKTLIIQTIIFTSLSLSVLSMNFLHSPTDLPDNTETFSIFAAGAIVNDLFLLPSVSKGDAKVRTFF